MYLLLCVYYIKLVLFSQLHESFFCRSKLDISMRILLPGNLTKKTFEYSFNRPVAARDSLTREGSVTCTVTATEFEFRQLFYCQFEKTCVACNTPV
jgi:hypothetical protein